jgi:ABC-type nitrate/sulfonate/bicarbonate transport system ATPase subunit
MTAVGSPGSRLEALDLSYAYSGPRPTQALEGLTLHVDDNEFLAVLGPVGCGKTTLLRILAGFLQPLSGSVRCDGSRVEGPSWKRGYVLQEDAIFPWMTVRENVEFGLLAKGLEPAARRAVSDELLQRIGLSAFEAAYPKELSAGMSKLVEVARVLATDGTREDPVRGAVSQATLAGDPLLRPVLGAQAGGLGGPPGPVS